MKVQYCHDIDVSDDIYVLILYVNFWHNFILTRANMPSGTK